MPDLDVIVFCLFPVPDLDVIVFCLFLMPDLEILSVSPKPEWLVSMEVSQ